LGSFEALDGDNYIDARQFGEENLGG